MVPLIGASIGVPTILAAIWGSLKLIRAKLKPPSPPAPPPPTARELTPEDLMPLLVSAVQRKRAKQEADAKAATEDQAKSEQLAAVLAQVEQLLGPPPPKS
jgi:mono/diheme cytochrome c family protein